jgi:hypothetical protein
VEKQQDCYHLCRSGSCHRDPGRFLEYSFLGHSSLLGLLGWKRSRRNCAAIITVTQAETNTIDNDKIIETTILIVIIKRIWKRNIVGVTFFRSIDDDIDGTIKAVIVEGK